MQFSVKAEHTAIYDCNTPPKYRHADVCLPLLIKSPYQNSNPTESFGITAVIH